MSAPRCTLVLLPGMDGTGELFGPFLDALGSQFEVRVVRYPVEGPQTYAALTEVARAALPESGRYLLLGESFSGPIAITLAADHPPGLAGVILCASFVRNPRPMLTRGLALMQGLPLPSAVLAPARWALLGRHAAPPLVALLRRALQQVGINALRARALALRRVDASDALARLRLPVLWMRATQDVLVPAVQTEHAKRLCAQMTLISIPAPHGLLQTRPDEAAREVRTFACGIMPISSNE